MYVPANFEDLKTKGAHLLGNTMLAAVAPEAG